MASSRLRILDVPDVTEVSLTAPRSLLARVHATHPCGGCAGNCCASGANVELTTVEALRLARAQLVTLEYVVQRVDCPPEKANRLASVPIPLDDGLTVLRLRQDDDGACALLHRLRDQGRCSAHAHRPALCRFYPFRLRVGGRTLEVGDQSLCPVRWLKSAELEAELARDHARWRRDLALERKLVTAWTATGGATRPWRDYAAFAATWLTSRMRWNWPLVVMHPARGR
ncbi:MAG: YkgJ family cysteine cluster protein [Myxococcota bacterium]